MANKTFKCNIIFNDGNPAIQELIEANNPPQAKKFAEAGLVASALQQIRWVEL